MFPSQGLAGSVFITSQETPAWVSCRVITANLRSAYRLAMENGEMQEFAFTADMSERALSLQDDEVLQLAKRIYDAKPKRLIFLDHAPHPLPLLTALAQFYPGQKLPDLYFHVFGDFSLMADKWLKTYPILAKTRVLFICASSRQATFVSNLLHSVGTAVDICPFPVDTDHFKADESLRDQWRSKLGVTEKEVVFLYTGRMSMQKNIIHLLEQFTRHMKSSDHPMRLFLAGPFDDVGAPFFGLRENLGECYGRYKTAFDALPEAARDRIHYFGNKSKDELVGLYNAADCYVNLSLHHDEDFGMAPAEALCCGLPALLTAWGGFTGFASPEPGDCRFLPIEHHESGGLKIDFVALQKEFSQIVASIPSETFATRMLRRQRYTERFSVSAITSCLRAIHNKPLCVFLGFSEKMKILAYCMEEPVPFPDGMRQDGLYKIIYSNYFA